jgi:hypothetical protein
MPAGDATTVSSLAQIDARPQTAATAHDLRDLKEMLSHQLVAYHEDTGRDVAKDHTSRNRQIELGPKLGKPGSTGKIAALACRNGRMPCCVGKMWLATVTSSRTRRASAR